MPPLPRLALVILFLPGLSACMSLPFVKPVEVPENRVINWYERRLSLEQRPDWKTQGRIALQVSNDAWSASISWRQVGGLYEIAIYGPLGRPRFLVEGGNHQIALTTGQGKKFAATDARRLIEQHMGWSVPVSGLRYWLLALLEPHRPGQQLFDDEGRLVELRQSGWKISYRDYRSVNGIDMPQKIRMEHDKLTVKLIFKDWFFGATERTVL